MESFTRALHGEGRRRLFFSLMCFMQMADLQFCFFQLQAYPFCTCVYRCCSFDFTRDEQMSATTVATKWAVVEKERTSGRRCRHGAWTAGIWSLQETCQFVMRNMLQNPRSRPSAVWHTIVFYAKFTNGQDRDAIFPPPPPRGDEISMQIENEMLSQKNRRDSWRKICVHAWVSAKVKTPPFVVVCQSRCGR